MLGAPPIAATPIYPIKSGAYCCEGGKTIMGYVPLEQLVHKSLDSVYKLVTLASKRALEIADGQPKLVEMDASVKPSTVALHEIFEGKITCRQIAK
jgi:DNA-directed RNA polymerase omega subunit